MLQTSESGFTSSKRRLFKDRAARIGVTSGGMMVIVALLLIFFYLLYVIAPVFEGADVEEINSFALPGNGQTVFLGLEEQNEIGYRLTSAGELFFFQIKQTEDHQPGEVLSKRTMALPVKVTSTASATARSNLLALGTEDGRVLAARPGFRVSFPKTDGPLKRVMTPTVSFPLGRDLLVVDPQRRRLNLLNIEIDEESATLAAVTDDGRLLVSTLTAEEDFLTEEIVWTPETSELDTALPSIEQLMLTPDQRILFVGSGNRLEIWDISDLDEPALKETLNPVHQGANLTAFHLLIGANSLIVGDDLGNVSQWFEVPTEQGRNFQKIRSFKAGGSVQNIIPEQVRKGFFVGTTDGQLSIYHTTGNSKLFEETMAQGAIDALAVSPRANGLLMEDEGKITFFKVRNEHPEVTFEALWQEIWYEGYPEPDYTWQSTSGSDDFESKLSLMPLTFGTIKAAAYAMLFAVPIAIAGAVYTAYFMTPTMRSSVKPTIELMEALPTVILGFLAGLWLAPVVEENLPGILAVLILLPLCMILTAYAWHRLPKDIKTRVPEGWQAVILIPVVLFAGWLSFSLSPWLELHLMDGNARVFITNELGVSFDQRNSIVVGLAMGFAVIPTIFSIAEDAIFSVPGHLTAGSLALGATPWQTLSRVVMLTASPGIFSAVMMGLGRAVGETMIVLMATGNTPLMDWSIFQGMRTLSANIAVEMPEAEVGSSHYRVLFLSAFALFVLTFVFNTASEFIRQRLREKYSSL